MINPLVSIIIPVYNGSNYLNLAIESALGQTYQNLEILVINDGSVDEGKTEKIALSYGDKIRYFKKENGGVSSALNYGISKMKGEYFSWLSHDDEYFPTKIEEQVKLINNRDAMTVYFCEDVQINEMSEELTTRKNKRRLNNNIKWDEMLLYLLKQKSLDGCTLLIHKSIFDVCGLFDETLRYNQDFDMWIRICLNRFSWFYNPDNIGVKSRVHKLQVTQTRKDLLYGDSERLSKSLIPQLIAISDKHNKYIYEYAKRSAKNNCKAVVKNCFKATAKTKLLTLKDRIVIKFVMLYGMVRPFFKKVYYRLFKHVKIK